MDTDERGEPTMLAERIEGLTGPDREVDAAIFEIFNPHMKRTPKKLGYFFDPEKTTPLAAQKYHISGGATAVCPRFTGSLDAAMTLVDAEWSCGMMWDYWERTAHVAVGPNAHAGFVLGQASISHLNREIAFALALCAAALRAREAGNG